MSKKEKLPNKELNQELEFKSLRKKVSTYRLAALLLFATLVTETLWLGNEWVSNNLERLNMVLAEKEIPYSKEIKKIIAPLRYSAIPDLMRSNVWISLNFPKRIWMLHDMVRFDNDGTPLLPENRYGTCGTLADYVYRKIKPLFNDKYDIKFVRAAESGYFLGPQTTHIVLKVTEKSGFFPETFIIDPSFRRYGKIDSFEDYLFIEDLENLAFIRERMVNKSFPINVIAPLIIKKGTIVGLVVEPVNSKFDPSNFALGLIASRRHKYASRYIYGIRKNEGELEENENKFLIKSLFTKKEYTILKEKISYLFSAIEGT